MAGVRLKRQQPGGDEVTPHDLRLVQDNVQAALDMLQSHLLLAKEIAKGAVGENAIGDGAIYDKHVNSAALLDGAKTKPRTIANDKILANTLTDGEISPTADINGSKLLNLSVGGGKITDLAITTAKLNDLAVTTIKINDLAVTTNKIGDLQVTTIKINDLAVTTAKLADLAVTTIKLNDLAVTTAKLADGAVTPAKLSAFQRSGFLYKLAADSGVINSYAAITFGTLVYDALNQRSGANFIPNQTGTWEWTARLRLEGGDIVPGYGISVAILDVTAGTVLYTSPPKQVFSDPAPAGGSAAGTSIDACIAELDWSIPVTAGNSYAIAFAFVKDIHFNTAAATWSVVTGQANAKADYTNPHVASVQIAGCYVRVRPVIQ